jgi:DNA polymerase-3 subunit gamma/tau
MDVLEIDAASNNGVDNVRDLRDDAIYTPSQVKMRVYIIDEVHMLSISAFNALLKIIEEPPEHLLFILATTELHKVPATILSRCQRFSFRRISQEDIAARLQYVAYEENIELDDTAARVLARLADGGMRDGLSLLDQCASATTGELTADKVYACLGIAGVQQCGELMAYIADHDTGSALSLLNRFYSEGKDMGALLDELACLTRDFMVMQSAPKEAIGLLSGVASDEEVKALSGRFTQPELVRMLDLIQKTAAGFVRSASRRLDAELCIVNLCQPELKLDAESLNARLTRLEDRINSGDISVRHSPEAAVQVDVAPVTEEMDKSKEEVPSETEILDEMPTGMWTEICAQVRKELKPPVSGFFAPNGPIQGVLQGNTFVLSCANSFTKTVVDKPEVLELVARKVSVKLGKPVRAVASDKSNVRNEQLEQLLQFGREHSNVINIKD